VVLLELGRNNVRKAVKLLEDSLAVLKKRNKLIRIAEKSEGGWKTLTSIYQTKLLVTRKTKKNQSHRKQSREED
jgi:hypothetical protein